MHGASRCARGGGAAPLPATADVEWRAPGAVRFLKPARVVVGGGEGIRGGVSSETKGPPWGPTRPARAPTTPLANNSQRLRGSCQVVHPVSRAADL